MMPKGHNAPASTYSFSSQPKPVSASRRKYRDPGEADTGIYREIKETCITWDKRVHRGNTYSMYTQNAIREALQDVTRDVAPKLQRRRKPNEPALFDTQLPARERIVVDLTAHLVAREDVVEVQAVEAQTDEFLPESPPEQYQPQKTGVDAQTQVGDGELFNFDFEVEPILDVLVNKTLEQSIMEVEEEHEMMSMAVFKAEWYHRQEVMMREWHAQVQVEWRRCEEKEAVVERKREERRREAQVLLKIQAMSAAKQHLSRLVPNAVGDLKEVAFPDMKGVAINRIFLPQLLGQVQQELRTMLVAERRLDGMVGRSVRERISAQAGALAEHKERRHELDRRRQEEAQIRQGRVRIYVDDGAGGQTPVGPIQISAGDSVDLVQSRVYEWLKENERGLASVWLWGVTLCIDREPVLSTAELFEAKAGQISMVPKPEPPPQEGGDIGADGAELGNGATRSNSGGVMAHGA